MNHVLSSTPIVVIPYFDKPFLVQTDASTTDIGVVLSQEGRPISFFGKKLNSTWQKWTIYEQELYAIVKTLKHWEHYPLHQDFILLSGHQALQLINSQISLNHMHLCWALFLQCFSFIIKHIAGRENWVVDVLSKRGEVLTTLTTTITGFNQLKNLSPSG